MLILTRKLSETIVINNETQITVLGVKGSQVRFGIKAPRDITVHRLEIQELVNKEKSELEKQHKSTKQVPITITKKSFDKEGSWIKPSPKRNQYYVSDGKVKSMPAGL